MISDKVECIFSFKCRFAFAKLQYHSWWFHETFGDIFFFVLSVSVCFFVGELTMRDIEVDECRFCLTTGYSRAFRGYFLENFGISTSGNLLRAEDSTNDSYHDINITCNVG